MKLITSILVIALLVTACQKETSKRVIFEEHFQGNSLNTDSWNYELGDGCPALCGWGNNERQFYTKENVTVSEGYLILTATKGDTLYKSGKITTKDKIEFQYGSIEVKAKLPQGQGLWPAIWMLGHDIDTNTWPACGEIDIMEYVGKTPHEIHTTLHTPDSFGQSKNTAISTIPDIENGFHIYKSVWDKNAIKFFIDNELVYTFSPELKNENTWPFDKPFYIILNMAIGGNFGGPQIDDSIFPQEFIIDYIKVFEL